MIDQCKSGSSTKDEGNEPVEDSHSIDSEPLRKKRHANEFYQLQTGPGHGDVKKTSVDHRLDSIEQLIIQLKSTIESLSSKVFATLIRSLFGF